MILHISQWVILAMGVATAALSGWLGVRFYSVRSPLGQALGIMCGAEVVAGVCTLLFAGTSVAGAYAALDPWIVLALRAVIFTALTGSTVHLYRVYRELTNGR